ncbi:hypothetical protein CISIN_1g0348951mg, partial [Citrus sinensis]
MSRSGQPPDLK